MPAINCDQVFAILTRGPFPSGESTDAAVEIHLSLCRSCRRIAEALRPEGSISEACLIPEESRELPYYWGVMVLPEELEPKEVPHNEVEDQQQEQQREQQTVVATAMERRIRRHHRRRISLFDRQEPLSYLSGWQLAIAVLMGAVLGISLKLLGYTSDFETERASYVRPAPVVTQKVHTAAMLPSNARQQLAAKLGVAPACWQDQPIDYHGATPESQASTFYSLSRNADLCCTKCHNATAPRFALRGTTARISRSCQVCHSDVPISHYDRPIP